jgi:hypothetical protein
MLELDPNFGISVWVVCSGQQRAQFSTFSVKRDFPNDRVAFRALSTICRPLGAAADRPVLRGRRAT